MLFNKLSRLLQPFGIKMKNGHFWNRGLTFTGLSTNYVVNWSTAQRRLKKNFNFVVELTQYSVNDRKSEIHTLYIYFV